MQYIGHGVWVSDDFAEVFDFAGDVDAIREIIKKEVEKGKIELKAEANQEP